MNMLGKHRIHVFDSAQTFVLQNNHLHLYDDDEQVVQVLDAQSLQVLALSRAKTELRNYHATITLYANNQIIYDDTPKEDAFSSMFGSQKQAMGLYFSHQNSFLKIHYTPNFVFNGRAYVFDKEQKLIPDDAEYQLLKMAPRNAVACVHNDHVYVYGGGEARNLESQLIRIHMPSKTRQVVTTFGKKPQGYSRHAMFHVAPHYLVLFHGFTSKDLTYWKLSCEEFIYGNEMYILDLQTSTWRHVKLHASVEDDTYMTLHGLYCIDVIGKRLIYSVGVKVLVIDLQDFVQDKVYDIRRNAFCDIVVATSVPPTKPKLAPELWAIVFAHLDTRDLIRVEMSCKAFFGIAKKFSWRSLFVNKYARTVYATFQNLQMEKQKLVQYYNETYDTHIVSEASPKQQTNKFSLLYSESAKYFSNTMQQAMPTNAKQAIKNMESIRKNGKSISVEGKCNILALASRHTYVAYCYLDYESSQIVFDWYDVARDQVLVERVDVYPVALPLPNTPAVCMCIEVIKSETQLAYGLYVSICNNNTFLLQKYKIVVTGGKAVVEFVQEQIMPSGVLDIKCMESGTIIANSYVGSCIWRDMKLILTLGVQVPNVPCCNVPLAGSIQNWHAIYLGQTTQAHDFYEIRYLDRTSENACKNGIVYAIVDGMSVKTTEVSTAHAAVLSGFGNSFYAFRAYYSECGRFMVDCSMIASGGSIPSQRYETNYRYFTLYKHPKAPPLMMHKRVSDFLHSSKISMYKTGYFLEQGSAIAAVVHDNMECIDCNTMLEYAKKDEYVTCVTSVVTPTQHAGTGNHRLLMNATDIGIIVLANCVYEKKQLATENQITLMWF